MAEYRINSFISLKLEDGITNIYIKGKKVRTCKHLLLKGAVDIEGDINSIDDIIEATRKQKEVEYSIDPETEFWGHCSYLQVWAEHNYDTNLLNDNLAFSLLFKLFEAGEPQAKKVYKEEIIKRSTTGYLPSFLSIFLAQRGYFLRIFNDQEKTEIMERVAVSIDAIPDEELLDQVLLTKRRFYKQIGIRDLLENNLTLFIKELKTLLNTYYDLESKLLRLILKTAGPDIITNILHISLQEECDIEIDTVIEDVFFSSLFSWEEMKERVKLFLDNVDFKLNSLDSNQFYLLSYARDILEKDFWGYVEKGENIVELEEILGNKFHLIFSENDLYELHMLVKIEESKITGLYIDFSEEYLDEWFASLGLEVIGKIKKAISNLTDLKEIQLRNVLLGPSMGYLTNLTSLTSLVLDDCKVTEIPESIGNLIILKRFNIRFNIGYITYFPNDLGIINVPESIGNCSELKNLSIHNIDKIPESIGNLKKLTHLYLGGAYTKLPSSIGECRLLRYLEAYGKLTALPDSIGNLTLLESVNLVENQLSSLPESIGNLKKLEKIDLSYNNDLQLPKSFTKLTNLKEFKWHRRYPTRYESSSPSSTTSRAKKESIDALEYFPPSIEKLELYGIGMSTVPMSVSKMKNLKKLYLSHSYIEEIPDFFSELRKLHTIKLDRNAITEIKHLNYPNLTELDLSYNRIREITGLENVKNLIVLDLSYNQISEIKGLEHLNLEQILKISLYKNQISADNYMKYTYKDHGIDCEKKNAHYLIKYCSDKNEIEEKEVVGEESDHPEDKISQKEKTLIKSSLYEAYKIVEDGEINECIVRLSLPDYARVANLLSNCSYTIKDIESRPFYSYNRGVELSKVLCTFREIIPLKPKLSEMIEKWKADYSFKFEDLVELTVPKNLYLGNPKSKVIAVKSFSFYPTATPFYQIVPYPHIDDDDPMEIIIDEKAYDKEIMYMVEDIGEYLLINSLFVQVDKSYNQILKYNYFNFLEKMKKEGKNWLRGGGTYQTKNVYERFLTTIEYLIREVNIDPLITSQKEAIIIFFSKTKTILDFIIKQATMATKIRNIKKGYIPMTLGRDDYISPEEADIYYGDPRLDEMLFSSIFFHFSHGEPRTKWKCTYQETQSKEK